MPPARSPADGPDIVVAALSARALAAAARRAGRRPAAIDLFADQDTRQLAEPCIPLPSDGLRLDADALMNALARPELRGLPLVYGAGFEEDPTLLARIAEDRPLLGNRAEVVARVKDPFRFAETLERLGIPHPPVARSLDGPPGDHLLKRIGGSGGGHIATSSTGTARPGWYLQRRIDGHAVSVLFLADGHRAAIVGLSRQWASPTADSPYRYGGGAGPWRCPKCVAQALPGLMSSLAAAFDLVGLNSADFLLNGRGLHLLEVNPRPGATLDVFDRRPMPPLFALHLDACAGRLPDRLPALPGCRAAAVVYADAPTRIDVGLRWPAWTADRPVTPATITAGQPVCTVLGDGTGIRAARRHVERRRRQLAVSAMMELQP
ncbi:ATP-grasp domain-containing protein [Azospirillum rugosum]|uniref:ATP-grasp superfamily ATP-dependent carboligase n=1 Tax=Azospirillum rugosum TaxID=416170 RepID=A0ABS4SWF7_9PROT|nr:ATP-grasp domain-containing protein [Azospirillum rugosum]MBP2296287.1 putative ATP-grasp superfamily ATP-dependent carboligase [Azospirillum rugosum]MDQ0529808.1 putative ATP-grasp superfamily ATP-dependent carboligase [Azospirillum rugosum]